MITNKNLYEMIINQMNSGNEELREKLKSQILEGADQIGHNHVQELYKVYSSGISDLQEQLNNKLDAIQNDLESEIRKNISDNSEDLFRRISDNYSKKINKLSADINEKLELQLNQIMNISKSLAEGVTNLQKDTAIIMETLQLVLTNMMLNKISDDINK